MLRWLLWGDNITMFLNMLLRNAATLRPLLVQSGVLHPWAHQRPLSKALKALPTLSMSPSDSRRPVPSKLKRALPPSFRTQRIPTHPVRGGSPRGGRGSCLVLPDPTYPSARLPPSERPHCCVLHPHSSPVWVPAAISPSTKARGIVLNPGPVMSLLHILSGWSSPSSSWHTNPGTPQHPAFADLSPAPSHASFVSAAQKD